MNRNQNVLIRNIRKKDIAINLEPVKEKIIRRAPNIHLDQVHSTLSFI
jgi:hypothetical protein